MNWWSSVTSAKALMRSWVICTHSPVPSGWPTAAWKSSNAASALVGMCSSSDPGSEISKARALSAHEAGACSGCRADVQRAPLHQMQTAELLDRAQKLLAAGPDG